MKRTLTAAMDPAASEGDILAYIRDARLQIETKKDAEVLQKFQMVVQLTKDSSEINSRLFSEAMRSLESMASGDEYSTFDRLVNLRSQHKPVPKDLEAQMDQALADVEARHKHEKEINDGEEKRAKDEANTAKDLYKEVRLELGLPPLPDSDRTSKGAK